MEIISPKTATTVATQRPKLKDSCDTCAASKIRCNKQKPLCGRCTKFGYRCLYSPARRTGLARRRNHAVSGIANNQKLSVSVLVSIPGSSGDSRNGKSREQMDEDEDEPQHQNSKVTAKSKSKSHANHPFNLTTTTTAPDNVVQSKSITPTMAKLQRRTLSGRERNDVTQTPDGVFLGNSCYDETARSESRRSGTTTGTDTTMPASRTDSTAPQPADVSDCSSVAVDTLLQLEWAKVQVQQKRNFDTAHAAIRAATSATRAMATVLVCPCSASHDVGLVVAAVCFSLLDVYCTISTTNTTTITTTAATTAADTDTATAPATTDASTPTAATDMDVGIGHSTARSSDPDRHLDQAREIQPVRSMPMTDASCLLLSTEDESLYQDLLAASNINTSRAGSSNPLSEDVTNLRILKELTKLAQLVQQFTQRYVHENGEEHSPDFLVSSSLADLLRSRLQFVIAEASG